MKNINKMKENKKWNKCQDQKQNRTQVKYLCSILRFKISGGLSEKKNWTIIHDEETNTFSGACETEDIAQKEISPAELHMSKPRRELLNNVPITNTKKHFQKPGYFPSH